MRVLVATDGSRAGGAALRFASNLVGGRGVGELVVVTVCSGRVPLASGRNGTGPVAQARRVLADAARVIGRRVSAVRFELIHSRNDDQIPGPSRDTRTAGSTSSRGGEGRDC